MKLKITTNSAEQTEQTAQKLAGKFKGGEVIELISDLGGGKTTFTKGLARGIGSADRVTSPTFTISKVYSGDKLEIHHFDFYRLADAGLMEHELHDIIGESGIITVIEWGDVVAHVLPSQRLTIHLKRTGDDSRELQLDYPENLSYLVESLK